MNLLIVCAHPLGKSLNQAIREAFLRGAKAGGHTIQVIDLYKENFNPVLNEDELRGKAAPDVRRHQTMIEKAEWMVFIYPVWWFRAPAILEGWFDRVFSSGFAFKYKTAIGNFGTPVGLLPIKKALVIDTYGSPGWAIRWFYGNSPWTHIRRELLKFCGVKTVRHFPCYGAPLASEKKRKQWLMKIEKIAAKLN